LARSRKSRRGGGQSQAGGKARTLSPSANGRSPAAVQTVEVQDVQDEVAPTEVAPLRGRRRVTGKRVLIGIGVVALVLVLAGAGYAYWSIQRTMPTINGTATLPGLSAPVTVTRDKYGVPHIVAANRQDLYAAQGYVHAQDRLFQMFYYRLVGTARLAETFGPAARNPDIFLRTLGMRRAAEAEYAQMAPEVRTALEAYARGVNAFLHSHTDSMPLEFNLLGAKMDDWQPVDSVTFGKVMAWDLSANWDVELIGADLVAALGPQRAAQLLPDYPREGPFIVPGASSGGLAPAVAAFNSAVRPWLPNTGLEGLGSNNWVVDGTKSATGKPLLANDPHLGVANPSIWYQVHLSTSDGNYDAVGFGFASAPGVVTGHNKDIAWGVTNVSADTQDLFIEKLDPAGHPGQYLTPDGWQRLEVLTETVIVKGAEPVTQTVRITRHGPIVSDALAAISSTIGTTIKEPLAMQWTAARPGHLMEALYDLQTASNWEQVRSALSKWSVPGQNFVYADRQGNIGYQMTGEQPIRKKGDGKVPVPGDTGEYDWSGYVPYDDLPRLYNPPEHFIATANNKNFGPDYAYPIAGAWSTPWRISRILEMLKAKDKLSIDDYKAMLVDTQSPVAKKIAPLLGKLQPEPGKAQEAVKQMQSWDGNVGADSVVAAIYEVTVQRAISETFGDDMGRELFEQYLGGAGASSLRSLELLLDSPDDPFWDKQGTSAKETRDDVLLSSLNSAISDMESGLGNDMSQWTWGKLHTFTARHTFGSQPVLSGIFNLTTVPMGGDGTTVAVASFERLEPFEMTTHQSYRMIVDTSDWSKSLGVFATGQSGQPFNKHWGDMLTAWQTGAFNPLLYTQQEIEANREGVLTLNP
jgi:penicillin G amidase